MLSSDSLVFEYFKKKGNDWAAKEKSAIKYLELKTPKEISTEFKKDDSFRSVISYIESVKNNISDELSGEDFKTMLQKLDLKDNKIVKHDLTIKLGEAIREATSGEDSKTETPKENIAVLLAASIAVAVILSYSKMLKQRRKTETKIIE